MSWFDFSNGQPGVPSPGRSSWPADLDEAVDAVGQARAQAGPSGATFDGQRDDSNVLWDGPIARFANRHRNLFVLIILIITGAVIATLALAGLALSQPWINDWGVWVVATALSVVGVTMVVTLTTPERAAVTFALQLGVSFSLNYLMIGVAF